MGRGASMVVALLCTAQFVIVLDVTIVAIALPVMQDGLGLTATELSWVITAYTLVFGRWRSERVGPRRPAERPPRLAVGVPRQRPRLPRGRAGHRPHREGAACSGPRAAGPPGRRPGHRGSWRPGPRPHPGGEP